MAGSWVDAKGSGCVGRWCGGEELNLHVLADT